MERLRKSVADEIIASDRDMNIPALAPELARVPILTIYATQGRAADNRVTAEALRRAGGAGDGAGDR